MNRKDLLYKDFINSMNIGFTLFKIVTNKKGKPIDCIVIEVNSAFEKLFGLKKKNLIGKKVSEVFPGFPKSNWVEIYGPVALQGKNTTFERLFEPLNRWFRVSAFSNEKGYFITLIDDITKQKQAEESLRHSEEKYQTLFETANDAIAVLNPQGKTISANQQAYKLTGLSEKDLGSHISKYNIFPPRSLAIIQEKMKARLRGKAVGPYEVEMHPKKGKPKIIEISASVLRDVKGTVVSDMVIMRDITERKLVFTALKGSEWKYRSLVENINIGVWRVTADLNGKILEANPALARIFGFSSPEELKQLKPIDLYQIPSDRKAFLERMNKFESVKAREHHLKKKDGTPIVVSLTASAHKDVHGKIDWIDGVIEDISERKRDEQKLRSEHDKFQGMLSALGHGVDIINKDYIIEFQNEFLKERFGDKRGKKCYVVYMGLKKPCDVCTTHKAIRTGKTIRIELVGADSKNYEVTSSPFTDVDGEVKVIELVRDITERKQAEEILRESEEKYRSLVQNVTIGVYRNSADVKGRFIEVNPAMVRMFGYKSPEELMRVSVSDLYQNPRDRKIVLKKFNQDGFVIGEEVRLKKKDSTLIIARLFARAHKNKESKVDWIDGVIEDITEHKKDEEALHRREAILDAVAFAAERFLRSADWKSSMQEILTRLGKAAQVSRVYIFEKHTAPNSRLLTSQRYEWVIKGITQQIDNPLMQNLDVKAAGFGRWVKTLTKGQVLYGNIRDFPARERKILSAQNILSIAIVPIFSQETLWGFIGFDDCLTEREWTQIELDTLKAAASIIGSTIQQQITVKLLSENEEKYRTLVENVNVGIYRNTADPSGKFVQANPAMCRIFGYDSSEELKQLSVANLYQNRQDRKAFIKKITKYGLVENEELRLKKKDGTPIIASVTASAHRDKTGKIDWFDGVIEDITERKRAEEALKQSEERYRTIFETANDGICIITRSGKLLSANQRIFEMTGLSEKDLGSNVFEHNILPPKSFAVVKEKIAARFAGKKVGPYEVEMHPKNGNPIIVEVTAALLHDTTGAVIGDVVVMHDVTDRNRIEESLKQAKESAEHANRVKTAFLANMSHELRTPMHSILGFTDLLIEREENGNKERKELLGIVKNSSDKLLHIINELLDLSRIESGKMIIEKKEFNIIETAKKLEKNYQPLAQAKGLIFNLKLNKNLPELIRGDELKIEQIVTNLLDNSLKFTHQGKIELYFGMLKGQKLAKNARFALASARREGILEYYVKDTGIGIEPQKMSNLFEQYLQTNGYLTRISGGARLGLAIVKQLTDLMKGKINVKSEIGKGAKFSIQQPVETR